MRGAAAVLTVAVLSAVSPALAQANVARRPPAAITLSNARSANLIEFALATAEGKVVARITKPLAAGQKIKLTLQKGAACVLEVSATFDDESENAGGQVNVCKDANVRFVD